VEVAFRGADDLGECPVWDEREQLLYRVDALAGAVLRLDVDAGVERRYDLGRRVGCEGGSHQERKYPSRAAWPAPHPRTS
jgi:sugar lactone lactonase YvrE